MKTLIYSMLMIFCLAWISGCEKDKLIVPDEFRQDSYYSDENIPDEIQELCGLWKLVSVSGGFSGTGHEPDFDYLDIRKGGMYRIVSNSSVIEFGHIAIDNSNYNISDVLQIKFIADYKFRNPYFYPGFTVDVDRNELNLNAYCCDFYNYHFKRLPKTFSEFRVNHFSHL